MPAACRRAAGRLEAQDVSASSHPRPPRYWLGRIGLSAVTVLLALAALEGFARIQARITGERIVEHRAFRATQPPPYRDAPYFSPEFLAESFEEPGGWETPPGTRLVLPRDYEGRYFHTSGGRRRTVGQPAAFDHRVLLFGGSTVYDGEVPDELTIASQLQGLLNHRPGDRYRVENLGATSVNVGQQLERLRGLDLASGDVVIFFDGANDILQSLYFRNPSGWIVGENQETIREMSPATALVLRLHRALKDRSAFVRRYLDPFDLVAAPPHLADREALHGLLDAMARTYREEILEADGIVAAAGGTFHHFLQPCLYTVEHPTPYERELLERYRGTHIIPAGLDVAFRKGYPRLREVVAALAAAGVSSRDLSGILDDRAPGDEIFLDWIHVNHEGNRIIARTLLEAVFPGPVDGAA
jgi:lysophospholipase L1-like esterase